MGHNCKDIHWLVDPITLANTMKIIYDFFLSNITQQALMLARGGTVTVRIIFKKATGKPYLPLFIKGLKKRIIKNGQDIQF